MIAKAKADFGKDGLELHETGVSADGGVSVGVLLDGRSWETKNTFERHQKLKQAVNAMAGVWPGGCSRLLSGIATTTVW